MSVSVMVTGAGGYLGSRVTARLSDAGYRVLGVTRKPFAFPGGAVKNVAVDLNDSPALEKVMADFRPDAIAHCAAYIPRRGDEDPDARSERDNADATRSLLQAASSAGVKRIAFASSISVYSGDGPASEAGFSEDDVPQPQGAYGLHKLVGEEACRDWAERTGGAAVSLRLAGLHGGGRRSGVVYNFIRSALDGAALQVDSPESIVQPLWVEDAARAMILACEPAEASRSAVANIAGAEQISLLDLAGQVIAMCGSDSSPAVGAKTGRSMTMSIDRAQRELGFKPTPLMDWVQAEIETVRASRV